MIDGVPVNYVRETSLPVNEQALEWENEDGTLHEGQSEGWENEVLTMDFCSGTLQSFLHRNPIEASNASDERLFLLPFDEVKDIFEQMAITMNAVNSEEASDGNVTIDIDSVKLRYTRISEKDSFDTGLLVPVWDFIGTKTDQYGYEVQNAVIMSINAIDGSVIDRSLGY